MKRCFRTLLWLTLACTALAGAPAKAQNCAFAISNLSFGLVNVLSGGVVDTAGTITITCSGLLFSASGRINVADGSGGAGPGGRTMSGAAGSTLRYQLYRNSARTQIFGSQYWSNGGGPILFDSAVLNILGLSTRIDFYGRIPAAQAQSAAGPYTSSFGAADVLIEYQACTAILVCLNRTATVPFTVTAEVQEECLISASDINFGSVGALTAAVPATGQLRVTCTPGTPYTVGLSNGLTGTSPTTRLMTSGNRSVRYGLYQDQSRTLPWGVAAGALAGTGTGGQQAHPVYGLVPAQSTPPPGVYSDTVTATVIY